MRNPLSRKIVEIQPSGIRKFFDVANEMEDAISLGVGEPDFDTPWRIREEGMFSLEKGRTFYTSNAGLKELRKEICNYLERKIHVKYDAVHETLVTVGGSEAIDVGLFGNGRTRTFVLGVVYFSSSSAVSLNSFFS